MYRTDALAGTFNIQQFIILIINNNSNYNINNRKWNVLNIFKKNYKPWDVAKFMMTIIWCKL